MFTVYTNIAKFFNKQIFLKGFFLYDRNIALIIRFYLRDKTIRKEWLHGLLWWKQLRCSLVHPIVVTELRVQEAAIVVHRSI